MMMCLKDIPISIHSSCSPGIPHRKDISQEYAVLSIHHSLGFRRIYCICVQRVLHCIMNEDHKSTLRPELGDLILGQHD